MAAIVAVIVITVCWSVRTLSGFWRNKAKRRRVAALQNGV